MVCVGDRCHQLDVQLPSEVLDVFLEINNRRVDLHLVLPIILRPLLLELELGAVSGHQSVDEINLDLVNIDYVGHISTWTIKAQIAINGAIVRAADFQTTFHNLCLAALQCECDGLLNDFEVTLGQQFYVDVLNGFVAAVDHYDLELDVVVVDFRDCFGVDGI